MSPPHEARLGVRKAGGETVVRESEISRASVRREVERLREIRVELTINSF